MRRTFTTAALAVTLLAGTASAQNLFSNAGGYGSNAIGLATGNTTRSGVAAPAGFQWSELQGDGVAPTWTVQNTTAGFGAAAGNRVADNFVVNDPAGWNVTGIRVYGYLTGSAATANPFTSLTFRLWNQTPNVGGAGVVFGDATTNIIGTSTVSNTNIYRVFGTTAPTGGIASAPGTTRLVREIFIPLNLNLAQGEYWLDFSTSGGFIPTVTVANQRNRPGDNGLQFLGASNTWGPMLDTGDPASGPDVGQDLPFVINGNVIPAPSALALLGLGGLAAARRRR